MMSQGLLYSQYKYYTARYAIYSSFPRMNTALQQKGLKLFAMHIIILQNERLAKFIQQSNAKKSPMF